jgi:hypothetical protein
MGENIKASDQDTLIDLAKTGEQRTTRMAALDEHAKLIEPYTDGLPYNRDRVIAAARDRLVSSFTSAVECGKYLIWLQAEEGVQALGLILENNFKEISRSTAFSFIRLAKIAVEHPKMQMLAEKQRSKAIALLEMLSNNDVEALESGGIVAGMTLEEVDKIPWRQLKEKLRLYKKRVDRGEEQLVKLEDENRKLKAALADDRKRLYGDVIVQFPPGDQHAIEQLHYAHDQMWIAFTVIHSIDKEKTSDGLVLIARDLLMHIHQLAVEFYTEVVEARPDIPDINETNYWAERLPGNADHFRKEKKDKDGKESGNK